MHSTPEPPPSSQPLAAGKSAERTAPCSRSVTCAPGPGMRASPPFCSATLMLMWPLKPRRKDRSGAVGGGGLRRPATGAPFAGGPSRLQVIAWLGLDVGKVMSALCWKFDFYDEPAFAPWPGLD